MPKYILVAVDGTNSHEWYNGGNSYTRKFFEQFNTQGGFKIYMHGPDDTITGKDADQRINYAKAFIENSVRSINLEQGNLEYGSTQVFAGNTAGLTSQALGRYDVTDIEFVFVGHSRGGAIVIELAKSLPKKALFMGLYDAVDMSWWIEADEIKNVKTVYHATRKDDSRSGWGNAGTTRDKSVDNYVPKSFQTSHGGVNGGYDLNPSGFTADRSCAIYTPFDNKNKLVYGRGAVLYYHTELQKAMEKKLLEKNKKEVENCIQDSMEADSFIRDAAASVGLQFDGTEKQSIAYQKTDEHYIKKR